MERTSNILETDINYSKTMSDESKYDSIQLNDMDSGINSTGSESNEEFIFYYHKGKFPISENLKDLTVINLKLSTGNEKIKYEAKQNDGECIPIICENLKENSAEKSWIFTKVQTYEDQHKKQPHTFVILPPEITSSDMLTIELPLRLSSKSSTILKKEKICRKKYRNLTRERRIKANARERTRVHTISAAYENLRRAIPSYSNLQKLSKLSVLRVARAYILTLARLKSNLENESDKTEAPLSSYFEALTGTIQSDRKLR